MRILGKSYLVSFILMLCSVNIAAEEISSTTIVGDQELPKVLFILPWKDIDSDIPESTPPLEYSRQFGSVERAEFVRMLTLLKK